MKLSDKEYLVSIKSILSRHPKLTVYGYGANKHKNKQTYHLELQSLIYKDQFCKALDALKHLLPAYKHPESVSAILDHLKRKHPTVCFQMGVLIAACVYKGCNIDQPQNGSFEVLVTYNNQEDGDDNIPM